MQAGSRGPEHLRVAVRDRIEQEPRRDLTACTEGSLPLQQPAWR
jgi:hypothetical protein